MNAKEKLIFFVDDDKLILNLLEYTFSNREGYEVHSYLSGEDCLANLKLNPRVVVVDHFFSKSISSSQTGMDILKLIKKENPSTAVIVLSNQDERALIDEYMHNGAYKFIKKNDYFIDELIGSLEEIFGVKKA
jgi:DNA-binding NtrC family response regulator